MGIPPDDSAAELMRVQRELAEARAQRPTGQLDRLLRQVVDLTPRGVWVLDPQGGTLLANAALVRMLRGQPTFARTFAAPEGAAHLRQRPPGVSESRDCLLVGQDGSRLQARILVTSLYGADGAFEGTFCSVEDVTERRLVEASQQRLAAIVESSDDAIIGKDLEGRVTSWNRAAERLTGFTAEEAIGQNIRFLIPEARRHEEAAILVRIRAGEVVEHHETTRRRKDGGEVPVLLSVSPIRGEDGEVIGASKIARDLTQQRQTEAALRRSETTRQAQKLEAIGRLAGGVAHDFNNLLTVILGHADVMLTELEPSDPLREDLLQIREAGQRAASLTQQLLAFGRKQLLQPRVVDLNEVVRQSERLLRRLLGEHVTMSILPAEPLGRVFADPHQLDQILMNLAVNARDAMPRGGSLTVETDNVALDAAYAEAHPGVAPGTYVMLAVTDTGEGMDPATLERIFEPFFTTKEQGKGTGLGLATVFGIVQQSGGHIWAASEPGKGTTFKAFLPCTDRAAAPVAPPRPAPLPRGTETLLLVEDEDAVRALMGTVLRKQGYQVLEAQNGGEAFLLSESFPAPIHLLLTDVVMPRVSGRQLAERLLQQRPGLRVLYVSGYNEDAALQQGALAEGFAFLTKPVTAEVLLQKVRDVLTAAP